MYIKTVIFINTTALLFNNLVQGFSSDTDIKYLCHPSRWFDGRYDGHKYTRMLGHENLRYFLCT